MAKPDEPNNLPKRILVIEDDRDVYAPIHLLLTHYGFEVTVITTLRDAREQCKKNYDLVVLDVKLPDGSGLDLLQQIRFSGQQTRVFILTSNTQADIDRQIRRLMPNQHFHKPLNFYKILDSIRGEFPEAVIQRERIRST